MAIRIGDVTFDGAARLLWVNDVEVHLSTKAFELLALLIERCPDAVSKADVHERLWPGTFVSASSLPSLVTEIRHALDDRRRDPPLIRTVHGFGYALQAPGLVGRTLADHSPVAWLIGSTGDVALPMGAHVLGRDGDGVVPLHSSTVSRRHARISLEAAGATVEDLGSKNGTYVNDQRVSGPMSVSDGDRIRFGSLVFTFRRGGSPLSTDTVASEIAGRRS